MLPHQKHFNVSLESVTVSQEGLFDLLARLVGKKKQASGSQKDKEDFNQLDYEEEKKIVKLLSSPQEIKGLTLKTGEIHGQYISGDLLGENTRADKVIPAIESHLTLERKVLKSSEAGVKALLKFMQTHADEVKEASDPEKHLSTLIRRAGVENLNPLKMSQSEFTAKALPNTGCYFEPAYKSWHYLDDDRNSTVKHLPALTHEQILAFGKALPKILQVLEDNRRIKINDSVLWGPFEGDRKKLEIFWDLTKDTDTPEEYLFNAKLVVEWGWLAALGAFDYATERALEAIYRWIYYSIDRSVETA